MLCTALVEGNSKEIIQQWLKEFESFMRYIMILSETLGPAKGSSDQIYYQKVQHKFSDVITFGFAFLFHQIHSTNIQQKQSPIQSNHVKPAKLQINPNSKVTPNSNTSRSSSPKDDQAINRMFALTQKNLVIYFVNIVYYKDLCKGLPAKGATAIAGDTAGGGSAVLQIFSKILVNKFSDQQESQLITLEDIKRYKATNFEDFPEYFSHEDWKVTFFHNEEINQILRAQMSPQMIQELFLTRR